MLDVMDVNRYGKDALQEKIINFVDFYDLKNFQEKIQSLFPYNVEYQSKFDSVYKISEEYSSLFKGNKKILINNFQLISQFTGISRKRNCKNSN